MPDPNEQWYPDSNPLRSQIYVGFTNDYDIQDGENILEFSEVFLDSLNMWDPNKPTRFTCIREHIYLFQPILTLQNSGLLTARIGVRITKYADPDNPELIYDRTLGALSAGARIEFGTGGLFQAGDYLEILFACTYLVGNPQFGTDKLYAGVKFSEFA
jgi:hypothetical protein